MLLPLTQQLSMYHVFILFMIAFPSKTQTRTQKLKFMYCLFFFIIISKHVKTDYYYDKSWM